MEGDDRVHTFKISRKQILIGLIVTALLLLLAYAVFNTYDAYTQMVVEQQQQHLLIISRAVSQSLNLYLSEQLRDIEILTRTPGFLNELEIYYETGESRGTKEYILSYMISQHRGLSRMYLLDKSGEVIFKYNQYPFLEDFDERILHLQELASREQSGIGSVFRISPTHYGMSLVNGVMDGNDYVGTVVSIVDLETLYEQFVASLSVRDSGYVMVKNQRGTVIMHPKTQMLTFNYFRDIEELEEKPQYESLNSMLKKQYEYEEGTAVYRAYSNGILPPEDEIAAFSRMNLGGTSWFVSAVMPYSEALKLVNENLGRFGMLVSAILAVVAAGILIILALQKNRQKLEIETRYLKDINYTLEELHQSREQVRHYQKLQTIGALAGGIAHEFNNLLTPIMGYSEFLKERFGQHNEYYEDIDEIYKAGARAKEIVEQILPFSRRETDSSGYRSVSLDAVIHDALKMIRMILPSSIQLEEQFVDTGVNVFGSATQLNQVLLNLCSNAYQSMEQDGGVLTIRVQRLLPPELPENFCPAAEGDYIRLEVADTGCGMPPEVLSHVFDPFFTTKVAGEGTGLGLSVVKNILISHGGFIEVNSVVGKGSHFFVYLPVTDLPAAKAGPKPKAVEDRTEKLPLLLVDDEARMVKYLKKRLVHKGYLVDAFTDPEEALKAFNENPDRWGLLIVDDTMPQYKGTALALRMKKCNSGLAVILITGFVERDALQMQQEKLINEIMMKPLDFEALLLTINRLL